MSRYPDKKIRHDRIRREAIVLYGNGCNCPGCPVSDPDILTLDHVQDDGKARRGDATSNWMEWERAGRSYQPTVYQILCANCHLYKTKGKPCVWHTPFGLDIVRLGLA